MMTNTGVDGAGRFAVSARAAVTAGLVGLLGLASLGLDPASAQQPYSTTITTTTLGPTPTPGSPNSAGAANALPPGTLQSKPPYQSSIGLPYGQGVPAPYAYGAGRPAPGTIAPTTKAPAKGKPSAPGSVEGEVGGEAATLGPAETGTAGAVAPVDPRLGLPRRLSSAPGTGQPPIKAAPDFTSGDPYARAAGSPALAQPFGVSPYKAPYSIDASGNYFNPPGMFNPNGSVTPNGSYVGTVDRQGRVFDKYGNQRGVIQKK